MSNETSRDDDTQTHGPTQARENDESNSTRTGQTVSIVIAVGAEDAENNDQQCNGPNEDLSEDLRSSQGRRSTGGTPMNDVRTLVNLVENIAHG